MSVSPWPHKNPLRKPTDRRHCSRPSAGAVHGVPFDFSLGFFLDDVKAGDARINREDLSAEQTGLAMSRSPVPVHFVLSDEQEDGDGKELPQHLPSSRQNVQGQLTVIWIAPYGSGRRSREPAIEIGLLAFSWALKCLEERLRSRLGVDPGLEGDRQSVSDRRCLMPSRGERFIPGSRVIIFMPRP